MPTHEAKVSLVAALHAFDVNAQIVSCRLKRCSYYDDGQCGFVSDEPLEIGDEGECMTYEPKW